MLMDGLEDVCRVRVKFNEIDSMRRGWHGAYVTYFEDGRESFGRHYPGIGYADMQRSGIYAPIYDLHLRFYAPLVLDDVAVVHTRYVYHPGARLEGSTVQLFIDTEGMLMVDSPDYYKEWQARYREQNDNHP